VIRVLEAPMALLATNNIPCPTSRRGMQFGATRLVAEVVGAARKAPRDPSGQTVPLVTDIGLIARADEEAGADALTVATLTQHGIDFAPEVPLGTKPVAYRPCH